MRGTGWLKNLDDPGDLNYQLPPELSVGLQPQQRALLHLQPARAENTRNQGATSSCVGQAGALCYELLLALLGQPYRRLSAHAGYWTARAYDALHNRDAGSYPRSFYRGLQRRGVCTEALHPSRANTINARPTAGAESEGYSRGGFVYSTLLQQGEARATAALALMARPLPGTFGLRVTRAFDDADGTHVVPAPTRDEPYRGLHMVTLVGYESGGEVVLIKNSWGRRYGEDGVARLHVDWLWAPGSGDVTFLLPEGEEVA